MAFICEYFTNYLLISKKMSTSNTSNLSSTTTLNATSATTSTTALNATSAASTTATPATATPVTWSDQEIRLLINQRKNRNIEYYRIIGRSRAGFWDSVARRINRAAGSNFTGRQCRRKFQNLVSIYYVSKNDK